jgi:hypothetical protein
MRTTESERREVAQKTPPKTSDEPEVLWEDGSVPEDVRWLLGGVPAEVPGGSVRPDGAPRIFRTSGKTHRVAGVSDKWPDREFLHFKVRTTDGAMYLLHHHMGSDTWLAQLLEVMDA